MFFITLLKIFFYPQEKTASQMETKQLTLPNGLCGLHKNQAFSLHLLEESLFS
jgi:hypothetical protein